MWRWIPLSCALLVFTPTPASSYSVLAHEALVDAAWNQSIVPLLRQRFPRASAEEITKARAYAYGGSVIQDLGYYPFGSRQFTNMVHYVRSGDFVESLLHEAKTVDEYAFAIGALAHYAADSEGHPIAVNRAVPIVYPKLRAKFGDEVIYAESPSRHLMVEFAFDVLQVAGDPQHGLQGYRDRIGFEVADALLDRAFFRTYGLQLRDLFNDVDLAIGTYRHAVSTTIPQMTDLAWKDKEKEIRAKTPNVTRGDFVFTLTRQQYETAYGARYRRPGALARVGYFLFKALPKVGPLKPLAFEPLTPETERLFVKSFEAARDRYRAWLGALANGSLTLANEDLDTGQSPDAMRNTLLEKTYAALVDMRERGKLLPPPALAGAIQRYADVSSAARRSPRVSP